MKRARRPDTRSTHGRSARLDSLTWLLREVPEWGLPADRKRHLEARVRRHMRTYHEPEQRDLAAAEVRLYGVLLDPVAPSGERRRAAAQWLTAQRELRMVRRRSTAGREGVPVVSRRYRENPFESRPRAVAVPDVEPCDDEPGRFEDEASNGGREAGDDNSAA